MYIQTLLPTLEASTKLSPAVSTSDKHSGQSLMFLRFYIAVYQ